MYGAPQSMWIQIDTASNIEARVLNYTFFEFNKTATRLEKDQSFKYEESFIIKYIADSPKHTGSHLHHRYQRDNGFLAS